MIRIAGKTKKDIKAAIASELNKAGWNTTEHNDPNDPEVIYLCHGEQGFVELHIGLQSYTKDKCSVEIAIYGGKEEDDATYSVEIENGSAGWAVLSSLTSIHDVLKKEYSLQ